MNIVTPSKIDLVHGSFANDSATAFRGGFPVSGGHGAETLSAVYIELDPGKSLGEHTDSPEELLLVLQGAVEFTVGDERARAQSGQMAVVPAMVPHNIRNVGEGLAKVIGFFGSPSVVATFVEPVQPFNERVLTFGQDPALTLP
jgi:quercetin dioxygenase-like cupin family protein